MPGFLARCVPKADRSYDPFAGAGPDERLPDGWSCTARRRPVGVAVIVEQDGLSFDLLIPRAAIADQPGDLDARIRRQAIGMVAMMDRPSGRTD